MIKLKPDIKFNSLEFLTTFGENI